MSTPTSVYLDSCCFIESVKVEAAVPVIEGRRNDVWFIKRLLQAHRDREITVYTSVLSIAECTHIGDSPVPPNIQRAFDALLSSGQYVHLVQITPFVCNDARNLRWLDQINLKGADSIHLASAIDRGCIEFLSFDSRFDRIDKYSDALRSKGIMIRSPSDTEALPSKYYQMELLDGDRDREDAAE